jgi:hypothetical protein
MMQMITEITGEFLEQTFRITDAPMIKFLHMIDPGKNPLIHLEIKFDSTNTSKTNVSGKIFFEAEIFMKFLMALSV